ncbi:hypothetical protein [Flavobacterium phragmitis]|uniref:Uncharacterized protein n=1 Tax=Flavobacterium phragmitis TaxID=739143 RepID=A0A1I1K3T3_9FLAO|nr:hypothetical protein [Flavobacterium phragmitis]SFC55161.1 hypothetical protein SAMN05216297_101227 [Flavobacterium phragmitis]
MKKILYVITILLSQTIFSQDFEYLKKVDTIYIKFKGCKNEKKYSIQTRVQPTNFDERAYNFLVKDKGYLYFQHQKYKNWYKKEENIVSEVRNVNRLF